MYTCMHVYTCACFDANMFSFKIEHLFLHTFFTLSLILTELRPNWANIASKLSKNGSHTKNDMFSEIF